MRSSFSSNDGLFNAACFYQALKVKFFALFGLHVSVLDCQKGDLETLLDERKKFPIRIFCNLFWNGFQQIGLKSRN